MEQFLKILKILGTLLEVILLFNLLIVVHELGHYWAAKWRGLKVDKFQIWFGPTLWKKTINGVQWGLGSIPAGGFVALPQMAPMEMVEGGDAEKRRNLPPISPLDKIIVAFAGPLFSFLLAIVFACVVWKVGRPVSSFEATTVLGTVVPGMPAYETGLRVGDEILTIEGTPIRSFFGLTNSVISGIALSDKESIEIVVRRPGEPEPIVFHVKPKAANSKGMFDRGTVRKIGVGPSALPVVGEIIPGSPADKAGMKTGDRVLSVDGQPITIGQMVDELGRRKEGSNIVLAVQRSADDGSSQSLEMTVQAIKPLKPDTYLPMIGVFWGGEVVLSHPSPMDQIHKAATTIITTVRALVSPTSDIGVKHLSGPIGIGGAFYDMLTSDYGWQLALWFGVVVNVNLAIMNLLPLPILDGGHITLAILEKIRRRPINIKVLEYLQTAFALLLLGFMLYVTVLDVGDRAKSSAPAEDAGPAVVFPETP